MISDLVYNSDLAQYQIGTGYGEDCGCHHKHHHKEGEDDCYFIPPPPYPPYAWLVPPPPPKYPYPPVEE